MTDPVRRLLTGFDRRRPEPELERELTVFDEIDELRAQRVERGAPQWFPRGGGPELARLAERRRRGELPSSR